MNVALYLRVSTGEQDHAPQRLELEAYVRQRGWTVVRVFVDTTSGARAERPGLAQLLAEMTERVFEAVLCVKLDRMARSLAHFAALVESFAKADVALICTSQGIDTSKSNACGRLQMAVLAAVAEFERELIRERTVAGIAVARANGKQIGRVSPVMPAAEKTRLQILGTWELNGRPGGYEGLGARLGGVSRATAWRLVRKYRHVDCSQLVTTMPIPEIEVD